MKLLDLFKKASAQPKLQRELDVAFWGLIRAGGVHRWRQGDPIRKQGRRMLIGLASYSGPDVELAEKILERHTLAEEDIIIELFNVLDVHDGQDFEGYIPGLGSVWQTPVVGVWEGGVLQRSAQGFAARRLVDEFVLNK